MKLQSTTMNAKCLWNVFRFSNTKRDLGLQGPYFGSGKLSKVAFTNDD